MPYTGNINMWDKCSPIYCFEDKLLICPLIHDLSRIMRTRPEEIHAHRPHW